MGSDGVLGRRFLAPVLPAAVVLFLVSYCYLGAARGAPVFVFLVRTTLGNLILGLAVASYAYYVTRSYTSPALWSGGPSALEGLLRVLLLLSMALTLYPVLRSLLGALWGRPTAASAALSVLISALVVPLTEGGGGRLLLAAGYTAAALVALAALISAGGLAEGFAELAELLSSVEALARELGVV